VKPHLKGNRAFTGARHLGRAPGSPAASGIVGFSHDVNFSPRVVLGLVGDGGLGFRVSWWFFDESAHPLAVSNFDPTLRTVVQSVPVPGVPGLLSPGGVAPTFRRLPAA